MPINCCVWNYGLIGNEMTWKIPNKRHDEWGTCYVEMSSFDEFVNFLAEHDVRGVVVKPGARYPISIQLKTTYSTCGEMGYRDKVDIAGARTLFDAIR